MSEQIPSIERSRIQALVAGHMALPWQIHAPDYQLITPSGRTFTRDRYLGDIEAGRLRYLRLDAGNGRGMPFQCWHTDSYEPVGDLWQAVWSQATAIE